MGFNRIYFCGAIIRRHDPCVAIRAVPIVEAMLSLVIIDHVLRDRAQNADVERNNPFSV